MRLIDADAYAEEMAKRQDACGKWMDSAIDELTLQRAEGAYSMLCEAKLTLDKMPTIDAVPVVRCGECIHANTVGFCTKNELFIDDDWFCADGERREG